MSDNKVFVLVDMDGVLADFNAGFLNKFRLVHPDKPYIPLSHLNTFYVEEQYEKEFGIGIEVKDIIESKGFFFDLPPIQNAVAGINALYDCKNVEVFICSSPLRNYSHCVQEKYNWVEKYLGLKFVERIILTRDKTLVNGHFLIDDKPSISGLQQASWTQILFQTHHNQHILPGKNQIKVSGWNDDTLFKIINEKCLSLNLK